MTTTAPDNAELVRRGYEAFNTADLATLTEIFAERATWHTPGKSPVAGDTRSRDETFARFGRYGGETAGTFRAELRTAAATDDGRVIALHHNSAERDGRTLDVDCCIVFEIEDGRVVSGREHFFDLHAWDAFWA
ncbi:MAG: nuclear transport factor 2 family protein [Thermoleophilia bacterium]|nr:nuclear transport factor 2 family protein [Thermoleophilia bacterium]